MNYVLLITRTSPISDDGALKDWDAKPYTDSSHIQILVIKDRCDMCNVVIHKLSKSSMSGYSIYRQQVLYGAIRVTS